MHDSSLRKYQNLTIPRLQTYACPNIYHRPPLSASPLNTHPDSSDLLYTFPASRHGRLQTGRTRLSRSRCCCLRRTMVHRPRKPTTRMPYLVFLNAARSSARSPPSAGPLSRACPGSPLSTCWATAGTCWRRGTGRHVCLLKPELDPHSVAHELVHRRL